MKREPALIIGSLAALVSAAIGLIVAFGVPVTPEQRTAILEVLAAVAPLVAMIVTRSYVYAPATVKAIEINARG